MKAVDVQPGEVYFWRDDRGLPWLSTVVGPPLVDGVALRRGAPREMAYFVPTLTYPLPGGPDELDRAEQRSVPCHKLLMTKAEWQRRLHLVVHAGEAERAAWRAEDQAWAPLLAALEKAGVQIEAGQGITGKCTRRFRLDREQAEWLLAMYEVKATLEHLSVPWVAVGVSSSGMPVAATAKAGYLHLEYADDDEGPSQALFQLGADDHEG